MITLEMSESKRNSQKEYDDFMKALPLHRLECPCCGHSGCLIKHGKYTRWLKSCGEEMEERSIQRVRCKECGATHAVVPTYIVPYQWEMLKVQIEILLHWLSDKNYKEVMEKNHLINESTVRTVIRRFRRHWEARLASAELSVAMEPEELVKRCFAHYGRQFLQIRRVPNQLFLENNIA